MFALRRKAVKFRFGVFGGDAVTFLSASPNDRF
jgi:hypothetical protein